MRKLTQRTMICSLALLLFSVLLAPEADAGWTRSFSTVDTFGDDIKLCEDVITLETRLTYQPDTFESQYPTFTNTIGALYPGGPTDFFAPNGIETIELYASAAGAAAENPSDIVAVATMPLLLTVPGDSSPGVFNRYEFEGEATVLTPDGLTDGTNVYAFSPFEEVELTIGDAPYGCTTDTDCGGVFGDVPTDIYFTDPVDWATCNEITTGTTTTTFSPQGTTTRAQLATLLWRYAGEPTGFTHSFTDVPDGLYFSEAVAWMAATGVTTGTTTTTFSPFDPVTRAQMATFLWRYAGEPTGFTHSFSDVQSPSFYEDAVAWMSATEITTGTTSTTFSPLDSLTRAQAVTFLWRYNNQR